MKKWLNVTISNEDDKENLRKFLFSLDLYFEVSGCFDSWHFEIKATEPEKKAINEYMQGGFIDPVYEVLAYYGKNFSGLADSCFTWSEEVAREKTYTFAACGYYCVIESPDGREEYTPEQILQMVGDEV